MFKVEDLINFIHQCPTQFHVVDYVSKHLKSNGYIEVFESESFSDFPKRGFFIRDNRAVVAWNEVNYKSSRILSTNIDFSCLRLKPNYQNNNKQYKRIRCTNYGSSQWYTWFGRDLKIAGRIIKFKDSKYIPKLVHIDEPIGFIPWPNSNLCGNFDLENDFHVCIGTEYSRTLQSILTKSVDYDIRFYDHQKPNIFGQFVHGQGLSCLVNAYISLVSFCSQKDEPNMSVLVLFDNEEIGGSTHVGSKSNILESMIGRIIPKNDSLAFKNNSIHMSLCSIESDLSPNMINLGDGMYKSSDTCLKEPFLGLFEEFLFLQKPRSNNKDIKLFPGKCIEKRSGISSIELFLPIHSLGSIRETCSLQDISALEKCLLFFFQNNDNIINV